MAVLVKGRTAGLRVALSLAGLGAVAWMVVAGFSAIGAEWAPLGQALRGVPVHGWLLLTVIWLAGLMAYGLVMTASMPGLSVGRALCLNLAGSAIGNSLPLGGAISLAATTAMARSWGFTRAQVTNFLMLTNVWNVLSRAGFGIAGGLWFVTVGPGAVGNARQWWIPIGTITALVVLGILFGRASSMVRVADAVSALHNTLRRRDQADGQDLGAALLRLRRQTSGLIRSSWRQLTLGMVGYFILLAVLLQVCLNGLGARPSLLLVLAAVGLERLVTALPITPGGAGAAELSLVACLSAGGVDNVTALAAALMFRLFTFAAEIPLGFAVTLGWYFLQRQKIRIASTV